jgi:hypothetical protein
VGATLILTKPPDGYTIGETSTNALMISYHTGLLNFHPADDMTHILRVSGLLHGLVVRADSPWKTLQEFIQYSKDNPQKLQVEMMKVYREHGVNPMGGCFPMLIQLPVLFSVYGGIRAYAYQFSQAPPILGINLGQPNLFLLVLYSIHEQR